jgi:glutathione S-transferase
LGDAIHLAGDRFSAADLAAALLSLLLMPSEAPYKWPARLPADFARAREELRASRLQMGASDLHAPSRRVAALVEETVI